MQMLLIYLSDLESDFPSVQILFVCCGRWILWVKGGWSGKRIPSGCLDLVMPPLLEPSMGCASDWRFLMTLPWKTSQNNGTMDFFQRALNFKIEAPSCLKNSITQFAQVHGGYFLMILASSQSHDRLLAFACMQAWFEHHEPNMKYDI